ncbi:hypothetical protein V6N13_125348 [Hibiscus sabdariffa]
MDIEPGEGEDLLAHQVSMGHAVSFKDKLLGAKKPEEGKLSITELDVEVKAEDVRTGGSSELPEICKYGHMKESCGSQEIAMDNVSNEVGQRNPTELYGPWMQVVNKMRRNTPNPTSARVVDRNIRDPERSGSRFAALAGEHESIIEVEDGLERVAATELEVEEQVVRPRIVKETIGGTTLDDKERMVLQRK